MFHYIYKITNLITNRFYVGMHSTSNVNDGYFGSGKILKRSISKYGKECHKKEIVKWCNSRDELVLLEKSLVTETFLSNPLTMNIRLGGEGGGGWTTEQQRSNNAKSQIKQKELKENSKWVDNRRQAVSAGLSAAYSEGRRIKRQPLNWLGRKHKDSTKEKQSAVKKGLYDGANNPSAKRVKDNEGNIFGTLKDCAKHHNIGVDAVNRRITKGMFELIPQ